MSGENTIRVNHQAPYLERVAGSFDAISLHQDIVAFVDPTGIPIHVGELTYRDRNPRRTDAPASTPSTANQERLDTALTNLRIPGGTGTNTNQQKAEMVDLRLRRITTALDNSSNTYDLDRVRAYLTRRGLSLEDVASIRPNTTDDEVIAALLNSLRQNPNHYLATDHATPTPATATQQSTLPTIREILHSLGVTYEVADSILEDGVITWQEAQSHGLMSRAFFNLADNNMDAERTNGNGELSQAEQDRLIQVAVRYARATGQTVDAILERYNSAASFGNTNLAAMEGARTQLIGQLRGKDLSTPEAVRTALTEIGISSDVIDLVLGFVTDINEMTAEVVAAALIRVSEAARDGDGTIARRFTATRHTQSTIMDWLHGGTGVGSGASAPAITAEQENSIRDNPQFREIFRYASRGRRKQLAIEFVRQYTQQGQVDLGRAAMRLIQEEANSRIARNQHVNMEGLDHLDQDDQVRQTFADTYLAQNRYEDAFNYARTMSSGQERTRILSSIVAACLATGNSRNANAAIQVPIEERLDLAYTILTYREGDAPLLANEQTEQQLLTLAKNYSESEISLPNGEEIRGQALQVIDEMIARYSGTHEVPRGEQGRPITLNQYRTQLQNEVEFTPLNVATIRHRIFPAGQPDESVNTSRFPQAMTDLDGIVQQANRTISASNSSTAAVLQARLERAHALTLMAEIAWYQGDQMWRSVHMALSRSELERTNAFQMFELSARIARQATLEFGMVLDGINTATEGSLVGTNLRDQIPFIGNMKINAASIIAKPIFQQRRNWQSNAEGNGRRSAHAYTLRYLFGLLAQYIPQDSVVRNIEIPQTANEEDSRTTSSELFKGMVSLRHDEAWDEVPDRRHNRHDISARPGMDTSILVRFNALFPSGVATGGSATNAAPAASVRRTPGGATGAQALQDAQAAVAHFNTLNTAQQQLPANITTARTAVQAAIEANPRGQRNTDAQALLAGLPQAPQGDNNPLPTEVTAFSTAAAHFNAVPESDIIPNITRRNQIVTEAMQLRRLIIRTYTDTNSPARLELARILNENQTFAQALDLPLATRRPAHTTRGTGGHPSTIDVVTGNSPAVVEPPAEPDGRAPSKAGPAVRVARDTQLPDPNAGLNETIERHSPVRPPVYTPSMRVDLNL